MTRVPEKVPGTGNLPGNLLSFLRNGGVPSQTDFRDINSTFDAHRKYSEGHFVREKIQCRALCEGRVKQGIMNWRWEAEGQGGAKAA